MTHHYRVLKLAYPQAHIYVCKHKRSVPSPRKGNDCTAPTGSHLTLRFSKLLVTKETEEREKFCADVVNWQEGWIRVTTAWNTGNYLNS
jgi:hypothetical protein